MKKTTKKSTTTKKKTLSMPKKDFVNESFDVYFNEELNKFMKVVVKYDLESKEAFVDRVEAIDERLHVVDLKLKMELDNKLHKVNLKRLDKNK